LFNFVLLLNTLVRITKDLLVEAPVSLWIFLHPGFQIKTFVYEKNLHLFAERKCNRCVGYYFSFSYYRADFIVGHLSVIAIYQSQSELINGVAGLYNTPKVFADSCKNHHGKFVLRLDLQCNAGYC
jgi:hypothetical protein